MHVGGRCANAGVPDEALCPQIAPKKKELARLVIHEAHLKTSHGVTYADIRTRYQHVATKYEKVTLNCFTVVDLIQTLKNP